MEILKWLFDGLLFFITGWAPIQECQAKSTAKQFFVEHIYSNKFVIALILYIIITIIMIISFLLRRNKFKKTLKGMLDHIIKTSFNAVYDNTRITVFKKRNGIACWFSMLIMRIKYRTTFGYSDMKNKVKFPHWTRSYLWIYSRVGQPNEENSLTHFLVPTNEKEVEGVVAQAAYSKGKIHPKFSKALTKKDCDDLRVILKNKEDVPEKIKTYMRQSHINSTETLLSMNRLAKEIWAWPLFRGSDNRLWGVIAFDRDGRKTRISKDKCRISKETEIENELINDTKMINILIQVR
jgi:hypothetical protein